MGERWNWGCGVEGEIPDSAEEMTLDEHRKLWKRFLRYWKCENYRMRQCYGCVYLRSAGNCLCCSHYLVTGKRRPKRKADGSCGGRRVFPGFAPDEAYKRFLREAAEYDAAIGSNAAATEPKRKCPIQWDAAYAYELYRREFSIFEISKIMGVKYSTVTSYAKSHKWFNPAHKVRATHTKEQIAEEAKAWEAHRGRKEERQTG